MNQQTEAFHGSDLEKIEAVYKIPARDIVPFGSNVNPLGPSPRLIRSISEHAGDIVQYPDREYSQLRAAIAKHTQAPWERILPGSGATELISLMMQTLRPKNACVLAPTYSEYQREIALGGGICHDFIQREEEGFLPDADRLLAHIRESGSDLLVICNPNNPTSVCLDRETVRRILEETASLGIFVLIDETYIEFTRDPSALSAAPLTKTYENLAVLGGVSKFFAAPGLRLGYGILGSYDLLEQIRQRQNPWSVHTLAASWGKTMFEDADYIKKSRDYISRERERCFAAVKKIPGLLPYPPQANFMLVKITRPDMTSHHLFEACIRQGLMIRDCSTFPSLKDRYIRFCFLKKEDNDRLLHVLEETMTRRGGL